MPGSTLQQQQLRICDICLAHLGINDNDKRLIDHFGGRLHLGFIEIRNKLQELRVNFGFIFILLRLAL
jgi:RNA-binding protein Luc7-like 2